jgi:beta-glucosidase
LLPLDKTKLKRIAVIGPLADRIIMNNYNGKAGKTVTALQGIQEYVAGQMFSVTHTLGGLVGGDTTGRWKRNRRRPPPIRPPNSQSR